VVLATPNGHVLHRFPYSEQLLSRSSEGWASVAPDRRPVPAPQPDGELVPPIQAAVNSSFTPIELDHPTRSASTARSPRLRTELEIAGLTSLTPAIELAAFHQAVLDDHTALHATIARLREVTSADDHAYFVDIAQFMAGMPVDQTTGAWWLDGEQGQPQSLAWPGHRPPSAPERRTLIKGAGVVSRGKRPPSSELARVKWGSAE
jgi:hypothetical protein